MQGASARKYDAFWRGDSQCSYVGPGRKYICYTAVGKAKEIPHTLAQPLLLNCKSHGTAGGAAEESARLRLGYAPMNAGLRAHRDAAMLDRI